MIDPKILAVLTFWFGNFQTNDSYFNERNQLWFGKSPANDSMIKSRFESDLKLAADGKYDSWKGDLKGSLALIILLDQFSLTLHRGKALGYRLSEKAIPIAKNMISKGWDKKLSPAERIFVYLPLEHSEIVSDQDQCVDLFKHLAAEATASFKKSMDGYLNFALRHQKVVKRFGRFPNRNQALNRKNTELENAFLASAEAPY